MFDRTLVGSRISLLVGFSVGIITSIAGLAIGLKWGIAGYYRRVDDVVMRFMDGLMAFPSLLLALALIAVLGASVLNVIMVICVVDTPRMVRVVREAVLTLREQQFVEAANALGTPTWRILARHIAPNTFAPVMVQATFIFALAIIVEANLSFLGAGVPPTTPSWGNIMGEGRTFLQIAVWVTFFFRVVPVVHGTVHRPCRRRTSGYFRPTLLPPRLTLTPGTRMRVFPQLWSRWIRSSPYL